MAKGPSPLALQKRSSTKMESSEASHVFIKRNRTTVPVDRHVGGLGERITEPPPCGSLNHLQGAFLRVSSGLPWWLRRLKIRLQCGRPAFDPWVGKIPWRRAWQPTPVFQPGRYSPWGRKVSDTTERLSIAPSFGPSFWLAWFADRTWYVSGSSHVYTPISQPRWILPKRYLGRDHPLM